MCTLYGLCYTSISFRNRVLDVSHSISLISLHSTQNLLADAIYMYEWDIFMRVEGISITSDNNFQIHLSNSSETAAAVVVAFA